MRSSRLFKVLSVCGVAAVGLIGAGWTIAEECDASVEATLGTQEEGQNVVMLEFGVDVNVQTDCAHVEFDLIIEELMPNGQTKKIRIPRMVKLNDGSATMVVEHRMPSSHSLRSYEARIVQCQTCEIMP